MKQRVILVTGGNGGLGQAIARAFLETGTTVFLSVRAARERAENLASEFSGRCHVVELDVRQPQSWKLAVEMIVSKHGGVDVLVNNAGKHEDGLLATLPEHAWSDVIQTNLDSVFHGCQAVLPAMISQRYGRIVNISSLSALLAPAGQTNYAAAKAGVVALTQSLAKEVARMNITVNAVCPGYIETEALAGMGTEEKKAAQMKVPIRRFGRPAEVAAAVRFLAGDDAGYITGAVLKVDGGIL